MLSALLLLQSPEAALQTWDRSLGPGLTFRMEVQAEPRLHVYGLLWDPREVRAEARLAGGTIYEAGDTNGRGTVSAMVRESGGQAGFNADFFQWTPDPGGDPSGFMVHRSELLSAPGTGNRSGALAWSHESPAQVIEPRIRMSAVLQGEELPLDMLNGRVPAGGLGFSTATAGQVYGQEALTVVRLSAGSPQPFSPGSRRHRVLAIETGVQRTDILPGQAVLAGSGPWAERLKTVTVGQTLESRVRLDGVPEEADEAVGGGPILLREGRYAGPVEASDAPRHPRTAVGILPDGRIWVLTVDGRQATGIGTTLTETAEILRRWGCTEALNLDGGGSTTLHAFGTTLNRPSGGTERTVANGVVLFAQARSGVESRLQIRDVPARLSVGGSARISAFLGERRVTPLAVWSAQGAGWVDQTGTVHGLTAGTVRVQVLLHHRGEVHAAAATIQVGS
ncbi:MAG: phosphodiester glycosidase family protein [Fimbriimonadaceae bacterium]|nr:phosphodiester glycosidase family protein [Fimbriimonadaceae bacterium]